MLRELWSEYGWVVLLLVLIAITILSFIPTGRRIAGFHRGVNFARKETYGDIIMGLVFLSFCGFVLYLLVRATIGRFATP